MPTQTAMKASKRADRNQIGQNVERKQRGQQRREDAGHDRAEMRRLELRCTAKTAAAESRRAPWSKRPAIVRRARRNVTDASPASAPISTGSTSQCSGAICPTAKDTGIGHIEHAPVGDAGQHQSHQHVEHRADAERAENADGNIAPRIARLLRRDRNAFEADDRRRRSCPRPRECR